MKYWYLDSANFVTLMLIDKGYYDYDYEEPKKRKLEVRRPSMSNNKLSDMLHRYGVGVKPPKEMNMEELQEYAIRNIEKK